MVGFWLKPTGKKNQNHCTRSGGVADGGYDFITPGVGTVFNLGQEFWLYLPEPISSKGSTNTFKPFNILDL
ncbi:hypothetical protein NG791_25235 [Laspinema sp. D1]|jgi:hypothetical protein|uniref:hypothetical protein n=1 Tax=Laspinema palackyanum TaxID=3231601 RepID=UPI003499876D|nr:hypothetical protein [Laspinema sp. D2b]